MSNQPPKRIITQPKRKKFAPAYDARRTKEVGATDDITRTVSNFFSFIYSTAHLVFVIGAVAGVLQLAYQTYIYASLRQWPSFSALDLAKIMGLEASVSQHTAIMGTFSPGALVGLLGFLIMQGSNFFIKRASR